jgi:hypothetical protein
MRRWSRGKRGWRSKESAIAIAREREREKERGKATAQTAGLSSATANRDFCGKGKEKYEIMAYSASSRFYDV